MQFDTPNNSRGPGPNYPAGSGSAMTLLMILYCIIFYLLIFQSQPAEAWGSDGHEIVGNIAYSRLTTEAKAAITSILNKGAQFSIEQKKQAHKISNKMSPLANVATWADKVRYTKAWHWTAPLHFIDVEDKTYEHGCHYEALPDKNSRNAGADIDHLSNAETCHFIYERDCKNDFCVAGAIANYSTIFGQEYNDDKFVIYKEKRHLRSPQVEQNIVSRDIGLAKNSTYLLVDSLMFITHFIGDIHQPLHCSRKSDKGGNSFKVHFEVHSEEKNKWSLHSVWDTGIIVKSVQEMFNNSRDAFEDEILRLIETEYADLIDTWLSCSDGRDKLCTTKWGEESFEDALRYSYMSETGAEIVDNSTISFEYYKSRLPIVQQRLALAGVRLAGTLELLFSQGI